MSNAEVNEREWKDFINQELDRLDAEIDQQHLGQSEAFRLGEHSMILRVRKALVENE